ncbi:peptidase associated/transthyretin-like domain-containing protein [Polaribacter glomeratus]|uniref:Carboxypeptidase-like regulatory domain-containing protein n=1 Tax=Polaribacter glomeratus TaxID=102 RepID=A0A2S7WX20_9FLAO|nr:hypothetical protein [Polaribacter glomeratus]PQJ82154.1 hypothetical protein BTO16_06010 [Polaribacter glomeratus]TXD66749.1 hypothetical protein ESX12_04325 [Polaribacter glomeratus]
MKKHLICCLLFFSILGFSQENRKLIIGKIFFGKAVVSDVHIINKNTKQGTITNDEGWFEIPVYIGDSLQFTHVNLQEKQLLITKEILTTKKIELTLEEKTYSLNEITLKKPRSIFYVDPQMMPPPIVNANTLNLPYANTIAKKDLSVLKFRSGGVVSLDNLFNTLNGNNKRKKELQKILLEDNGLSKIRKHFTDDFFITDLHIKREQINPFLNYCFKSNIVAYFNRNENIKVTKILMDQSKTFPQIVNTDTLIVFKK